MGSGFALLELPTMIFRVPSGAGGNTRLSHREAVSIQGRKQALHVLRGLRFKYATPRWGLLKLLKNISK